MNGQSRLSLLSIVSQVPKMFSSHFLVVHAQFERSKRGQRHIVVPVPFAYTRPACCNHICFGDLCFDFWNIVLVPVVCPCLDYALQRETYSGYFDQNQRNHCKYHTLPYLRIPHIQPNMQTDCC